LIQLRSTLALSAVAETILGFSRVSVGVDAPPPPLHEAIERKMKPAASNRAIRSHTFIPPPKRENESQWGCLPLGFNVESIEYLDDFHFIA
jgi:hypothetical protein